MQNGLPKETAENVYLTAVMMSFFAEGGLHALGQRTGEYVKFLLAEKGIEDPADFEDRLQETLTNASEAFPRFMKAKEARKRAKRS